MGANFGGDGTPREYYHIFNGTLVKKVKKSEAVNDQGQVLPTYNRRENKNGETIYEREAKYGIDGMLRRIDWAEGRFGRELRLTLVDDGVEYVITVQALQKDGTFQNYAGSIVDQLGLIDFALPVRISPYKDLEYNGKFYTGVNISQHQGDEDWTSVKKLEPELWGKIKKIKPMAEKKETADGFKWDFTEVSKVQKTFLMRNIDRLVEFLDKRTDVDEPQSQPSPEPEEESQEELQTDDLPF